MSADDQRMLKHAEQVDSRTYDDSKSPSAKVGLDYDKYLCLAFVGSQQFDRASAPSTKFGVFAVVLNEDYQLRRFGEERLQLVSVHLLEPLSSAISQPRRILNDGDNPSDTSSEKTWELISHWLGDCMSNHDRCNKTRQIGRANRWYPTRLIDLDQSSSPPHSFRVVETSDAAIYGDYVTLSHSWGSASILKLTCGLLASFYSGMPISSLPQTFQDAIIVTRRLGVRYIWIDSLCIIQDAPEKADWLRESVQMHLVYSYALLNIAATGATDSSGGLFVQRDPRSLQSAEIDILPSYILDDDTGHPSPSEKHLSVSDEPLLRCIIIDFGFWDEQLSRAPLNKRAWVLQERLLAPRVIHFGHGQVLWECCEKDAAESYPDGLPLALEFGKDTRFKGLEPDTDGAKLRSTSCQDDEARFFAHELWVRIVQSYTRALLTNPNDKLVALSGIAKRLSAEHDGALDDEYVVGMWRKYLACELLWKVGNGHQVDGRRSKRVPEYRAPSFSWAAVDGCVDPPHCTDQGVILEIEDFEISYAIKGDRTGPVDPTRRWQGKGSEIHNFVKVKGTLKRLALHRDPLMSSAMRTFWTPEINGQKLPISKTQWTSVVLDDEDDVKLSQIHSVQASGDEVAKQAESQEVFCMPCRKPAGRWTYLDCLVLVLLEGERGVFRRIGVITASNDAIPLIMLNHRNERELPCYAYDEHSQRHSIYIV